MPTYPLMWYRNGEEAAELSSFKLDIISISSLPHVLLICKLPHRPLTQGQQIPQITLETQMSPVKPLVNSSLISNSEKLRY